MQHRVTLTMQVAADTAADAEAVGLAAAEHLLETFNDDESIEPEIWAKAGPSALETAARALLAAFGGNAPDWLRAEAQALADALESAQ